MKLAKTTNPRPRRKSAPAVSGTLNATRSTYKKPKKNRFFPLYAYVKWRVTMTGSITSPPARRVVEGRQKHYQGWELQQLSALMNGEWLMEGSVLLALGQKQASPGEHVPIRLGAASGSGYKLASSRPEPPHTWED